MHPLLKFRQESRCKIEKGKSAACKKAGAFSASFATGIFSVNSKMALTWVARFNMSGYLPSLAFLSFYYCINFEPKYSQGEQSEEVGIRKTVGSLRRRWWPVL
jgi:hypothetical protein